MTHLNQCWGMLGRPGWEHYATLSLIVLSSLVTLWSCIILRYGNFCVLKFWVVKKKVPKWYRCHLSVICNPQSPCVLESLGKNGNTFSSQLKVREFWTDWKSQGILASFYSFSDLLIEVYLWSKFLYLFNSLNKTVRKNTGEWEKYWKSWGNLSVRKHTY